MLASLRNPSPERAQQLNRVGDALLLGAASFAAAYQDGAFHWRVALAVLAVGTMCWTVAARALRQYATDNGRGFSEDVMLTLVMLTAVIVPVALLGLCFPHQGIPGQLGRFVVALVPTVLLLRVGAVGLPLWRSRSTVDVLIAGIGPFGRLTGAEIRDDDSPRRLIGYLRFHDETLESRLHAPVFGGVADLEAALRERVVEEVYFASTAGEHSAEVQAGIRTCERLGIPFALPACPYRLTRAKQQRAIGGGATDGYTHFLTMQVKPLQWAMKRLFDVLASGTALVVLSPLLLAAAVLVKLTSRGPILFKQERVGLHGRTFHMLKFRSMIVNADEMKARLLSQNEQAGPVFKMKHDPRVTAFGRLMRKHSIDELPQLVNVLRGDMAIVGPRPPIPSEVAKYEGWQRRRLSVRPGLTCVWQVSGRSEISFQEWMLLDMRYIDHWSLAADFELIWKTVPVVLTGRGAS